VIVANFLAGLLIGVLLGLAVAPVLRSWLMWKSTEEARQGVPTVVETERTRVEP
jgi:hypothetical protein